MASRTLYPPLIESSLSAFMVSKGTLKVPISYSKFNNPSDVASAQVGITKKDTGASVVNTVDSGGRYRKTGIILNVPIESITVDGQTTYYIEIKTDDLKEGWHSGWYYKIQVRLSSVNYSGSGNDEQAWINIHASDFSEWSTVCIVKAIGNITINITSFGCSYEAGGGSATGSGTSMTFVGNYSCEDPTETLGYYRIKLFNYPRNAGDEPIDDSGYIYNNAINVNEFNYSFKVIPEGGTTQYVVELEYNTINDFNEIVNIDYTLTFRRLAPIGINLITIENDEWNILDGLTSLGEEEDEGRVAIKLFSASEEPFTGSVVLRRAASRTKFEIWEDIQIFKFENQVVNSLPIWYDYTIESGIWYKYGIQAINNANERSPLRTIDPIIRNFNFSYLLGENNQQLKLMFNNDMGSFKRQVAESHTDTIGGKYSIFSRNAALDYKTFPVNGLISFYMDENNTFTNKRIVYNGSEIANLYENYNINNGILQYDYIYEREFRKLVSDFLYDGKPKLFKSTTEGNIIVRITDVSMSPQQSVGRIVYSFSANAYEIADDTVDNYKKYNLLVLPEISSL